VRAGHHVELALELDRVLRPQRFQAAQVLVHAHAPSLEGDVSSGVLVGQPADPEPDGESTAGQHVQGGHGLGEQRRGGERCADGRRPQADPLGVPGHVRERDQRIVHRAVRGVASRTCRWVVCRVERRVEPTLGRVKHALERPQRGVPQVLGASGDADHRAGGCPAPRHRQAEPEQRQVVCHRARLCHVGGEAHVVPKRRRSRSLATCRRGWRRCKRGDDPANFCILGAE